MKKTIYLTILCLSSFLLRAQDFIYTKKEGVLHVKILEVASSLIRFKKTENINGPNYTIAKRFIDSIKYENGDKELFAFSGKRLPEKHVKELEKFKALPNNIISTGFELSAYTLPLISTPGDDVTPNATWYIAYERLLVQQRIGVSVSPFIAGNRMYYGASAAIQAYPKNKGRMRLGLGPVFHYSAQNIEVKYSHYVPGARFSNSIRMKTKAYISSAAFNLSILENINRQIFIDSDLFLGAVMKQTTLFKENLPDQWSKYRNTKNGPMAGFRIGVGYRF